MIGRTIGPYEVLSVLGSGGMGEVYRARDTRLGRDVAIKTLLSRLTADAASRARFEREARLLASLGHPNIGAVFGLEEVPDHTGGRPTMALIMELVEGPTLAERVGRGPMPVDEALVAARQIAEALEYAHDRGVIHRDLKPANIKLTPDGTVKVLDFGLAKALDSDSSGASADNKPTLTNHATAAGVILGTAAYMAPEQAKGRPADRRADVWAFGCVFYEMLTGRSLFRGDSVSETLAEVIKSEADLTRLPADVPEPVRDLLARCLEKDPRERLQAIGEARVMLGRTTSLRSGVRLAGPSTATAHATTARPVAPGRWLLAGSAALALVIGLGAGALFKPAAHAGPPMRFHQVTSSPGVQSHPALSPDGRSVALVWNRDGHFNIYVGLVAGGKLLQITTDANLKSRPRWSPDGSTIAYSQLNDWGVWDVWLVPALGGTPRRLIVGGRDPAWSPDGTQIVYQHVACACLWIADATGQNAHELTKQNYDAQLSPAFSPDGRSVAFANRAPGPYGRISVVDVATGQVKDLTGGETYRSSPAWSPDGRSLYVASGQSGTVNIWKLPVAGGPAEQITNGQGDDADVDVSTDGSALIFSSWRQTVQVGLAELGVAGSARVLLEDPVRNAVAPTFSPDGRHIAFFTNRKGDEREVVWVADADGASPVRLVSDDRKNVFPRWTPDSRSLVYQSETVLGGHRRITPGVD